MEDILSLNYSVGGGAGGGSKNQKKKTTSDGRKKTSGTSNTSSSSVQEAGKKPVANKDISEYLKGDQILYQDLLKDEIAQVDRKLLVDSKKAGQLGGTVWWDRGDEEFGNPVSIHSFI